MIRTAPARKRQANHGRIDTAVSVTHNHAWVNGKLDHFSVTSVRESSANASADAISCDAMIHDITTHRNRFVAEHRLVLTAPDVREVRDCLVLAKRHLKEAVQFEDTVVELGRAKIRSVKVRVGGRALLQFISGNRANSMFTVVDAVCADAEFTAQGQSKAK